LVAAAVHVVVRPVVTHDGDGDGDDGGGGGGGGGGGAVGAAGEGLAFGTGVAARAVVVTQMTRAADMSPARNSGRANTLRSIVVSRDLPVAEPDERVVRGVRCQRWRNHTIDSGYHTRPDRHLGR